MLKQFLLHALLHISTKEFISHSSGVTNTYVHSSTHVLVLHCKFPVLLDKILIRWKDVRKTSILQSSDVAIVPDIGIPMIILPGSWRYDCSYGPECNMQNKEKKKLEHEKKVNVDHPQGTPDKNN